MFIQDFLLLCSSLNVCIITLFSVKMLLHLCNVAVPLTSTYRHRHVWSAVFPHVLKYSLRKRHVRRSFNEQPWDSKCLKYCLKGLLLSKQQLVVSFHLCDAILNGAWVAAWRHLDASRFSSCTVLFLALCGLQNTLLTNDLFSVMSSCYRVIRAHYFSQWLHMTVYDCETCTAEY